MYNVKINRIVNTEITYRILIPIGQRSTIVLYNFYFYTYYLPILLFSFKIITHDQKRKKS